MDQYISLNYKYKFNIHLVLIGARDAYLFYDSTKKYILLIIKLNYPELKYTPKCGQHPTSCGTYIHIKDLPELKSYEDIGKVLGYTCPTNDFFPKKDRTRHHIKYYSNNIIFMSEVCTEWNGEIKEKLETKIATWNSIIDKDFGQITYNIKRYDDSSFACHK